MWRHGGTETVWAHSGDQSAAAMSWDARRPQKLEGARKDAPQTIRSSVSSLIGFPMPSLQASLDIAWEHLSPQLHPLWWGACKQVIKGDHPWLTISGSKEQRSLVELKLFFSLCGSSFIFYLVLRNRVYFILVPHSLFLWESASSWFPLTDCVLVLVWQEWIPMQF